MDTDFDLRSLFSVEGLVVVITGGGTGIGLMAARALSANKAKAVYIVGRRKETLDEAISQCAGSNVIPLVGDVTSKADLSRIADRVKSDHGYCDVLFANSGVGGPGTAFQVPAGKTEGNKEDDKSALQKWRDELWEVDMDDFTKTLHINCTGVLYTALAFLPLLLASNERASSHPTRSQSAQILVTASIASFHRSMASNPAYPASKAAVVHLVKTLATKLTSEGIRVNALAPGLYPSQLTAGHGSVKGGKRPEEEGSMPKEVVPLARMGSEGDMAATIVWMLGRGGAYLSGSVVVSDGGRLGILPATY